MKRLFERESIDKVYREQALEVYQTIKDWLSNNIDLMIEREQRGEWPWETRDFQRVSGGGYVLQYDQTFDENIPLDVVFVPEMTNPKSGMKATGGIGHRERSGKIVIVMTSLLGPWDLTYLDIRFTKETFVHEFIHYLNMQRRKGSKRKGPAFDVIADYYNNPEEFNAFYQEGVLKVDSYLSTDIIWQKYLII